MFLKTVQSGGGTSELRIGYTTANWQVGSYIVFANINGMPKQVSYALDGLSDYYYTIGNDLYKNGSKVSADIVTFSENNIRIALSGTGGARNCKCTVIYE